MTYWLSCISYERFQADEGYEFAVDGYQESEFNRALRVGLGDRFVYYIKGLELFAALAESRGRCYLDWTRLWPDGSYPVRFERRPLLVLPRAQMVPALPLISRLSLDHPLRHDLQEISQADYELIEREMRRMGAT